MGGAASIIVFSLSYAPGPLHTISIILRWLLVWNPSFTFSHGLLLVVSGSFSFTDDEDKWKVFSLDKAGGDLIFFIIQIVFYWVMIFLIENKCFINKTGTAVRMGGYHQLPSENIPGINMEELEDPDVQQEEERVASLTPNDLEIRTFLLNKIYKTSGRTMHAVKDVSFGIEFGE